MEEALAELESTGKHPIVAQTGLDDEKIGSPGGYLRLDMYITTCADGGFHIPILFAKGLKEEYKRLQIFKVSNLRSLFVNRSQIV